jgi:hypothetical protein
MNDKLRRKQDNPRRRFYVKPAAKCISLKDEEALSEFCKQKPFTPKDLKEIVKDTLKKYQS